MRMQVVGAETLARQMREIDRQQEAGLHMFVQKQAEALISDLLRLPPGPNGKPEYSFVVVENPQQASAEVYQTTPGGTAEADGNKFALTGTRPHRIEGRPLRWFDKQGVPHFAMFVQHPGIKPKTNQNRSRRTIRPTPGTSGALELALAQFASRQVNKG